MSARRSIPMSNEIVENACIDQNVFSYQKFFDNDWSKEMFELVENSPLKKAFDSLIFAWRTANGAHLLPRLMAESLRSFAEGKHGGNLGFAASYSETLIKGFVNNLEARTHFNFSHDQRVAVRRALTQIEREARDSFKTAQAQVGFDINQYWNFLTNNNEFQFCILGIQRINYCSLFFAYEDFLANTIRTKVANYTSKPPSTITTAFPQHFGKLLADFCWSDAEVDLARLVRHAVAHNNGCFGTGLEKYRTRFDDATVTDSPRIYDDRFILIDGKIQITPRNTAYLFRVLKERVSRIVEQVA
jgi:hypothetical protein